MHQDPELRPEVAGRTMSQSQQPDLRAVFQNARSQANAIRDLSVSDRIERISRLKKVILDRREQIIDQIQKETGKSRSDALMSEIFAVLEHLDYLEKSAVKVLSDRKAHTPIALMGKSSWVYFEPVGTVLVISPWNYPFYQAIVPCTSSFIAGNATLYKPSEYTPLKGLVESVLSAAEFGSGWIQVAYGDGAVASQLIEMRPDKIFFTGSVKTGKLIMAQAARQLIPVELELGGKDPMIVFDDANLERAAAGAAWGAMTNTGQSCTSVERLYVQKSAYEPFKKALLSEISKIKQSVDSDGDADIGHMTVDFQLKTIREHVEEARRDGAIQLTGQDWDGNSRAVPPIVLENVRPEMKVVRDETFGPVLPLIAFETEDQAIELANHSEYGLSASVWTADQTRAVRVARALQTGNVSINNVMLTEGNHALPFGGIKMSGFGRYKGEFGLYAFSNIKSILIDKNSSKIEANWYPYTKKKYQLFTTMMVGLFSGGLLQFLKFIVAGLKLESYSNKVGKKGRTAD
ncbi:MAG: aldehyde dehydrogenase family protein [Bdellovibrionota bacterium]